jgi:indole-3-glycerol phosphate synthase
LRKDFIFDPYQIYESRANGADAVLLIAMALEDAQAGEYMALAGELGLGVLLEVHDMAELERALKLDAPVIGINNRDLGTLDISLETTFRLKAEIPGGHTVVSESGISTRDDVLRLEEAAVDAMLVGTTFMKAPDVGAKVDELLGKA